MICELCGRTLTVAAGEPAVCSDCEREVRAMNGVRFQDLSDRAQTKIEREDPGEQCSWFAKPHGVGYTLRSVQRHLVDLAVAQGMTAEAGWLPVLMLTEQDEQDTLEDDGDWPG